MKSKTVAVSAIAGVHFDGGHFVLDEYADAIAEAIIETFSVTPGGFVGPIKRA